MLSCSSCGPAIAAISFFSDFPAPVLRCPTRASVSFLDSFRYIVPFLSQYHRRNPAYFLSHSSTSAGVSAATASVAVLYRCRMNLCFASRAIATLPRQLQRRHPSRSQGQEHSSNIRLATPGSASPIFTALRPSPHSYAGGNPAPKPDSSKPYFLPETLNQSSEETPIPRIPRGPPTPQAPPTKFRTVRGLWIPHLPRTLVADAPSPGAEPPGSPTYFQHECLYW